MMAMDGGLLSLKWNNHRSTFFHVLSTIRRKESYCDVTLACDGKFYPVHKLVLSTCSDYFEEMFERTNCKHPIIVLKDIRHEDLEALLNYMYLGEVNVLQTDLSGLIKAAECLRIKGLAVPDEAPNEREGHQESKRNVPWPSEGPEVKRKKPDEIHTPKLNQSVSERQQPPPRPQISFREPYREPQRIREVHQTPSPAAPAPLPHSPETHVPNPANTAVSESSSEISSRPRQNSGSGETAVAPPSSEGESTGTHDNEVMLEETLVKEEPHDDYTEADDTKESFHSDSDVGLNYPEHSTIGRDVSAAPFNPPAIRPANQPQTMEDLVAQVLPGASGLQVKSSWEGDRSLLGMSFEGYSGNQGSQLGAEVVDGVTRKLNHNICQHCGYVARDKTNLRKHYYTHTGEKPYACMYCFYKTTQNSNLRTHMRRHHPQFMPPEAS